MATFYVDFNNGSDANSGSQSAPWKNWTYGIAGNRVSGGDTIVLLPGIYTTYHGTATRGITNVGGTGGDVTVTGENVEIQLPANLTETAIVGAGGGPRLVLDGLRFANPSTVNVKLGEGTVADAKLLFRNCDIDMNIARILFNSNRGLIEIENSRVRSTRAVCTGRAAGGTIAVRGVTFDLLHFIFTSTQQLNFAMEDSEVLASTYNRLLIYTNTNLLSGTFRRNKIHLSDTLTEPLFFYSNVAKSIEAGTFVVDNNILYRNITGMNDASRRTTYHKISSFESGCDYVPGKNYFVAFDSPVATAVLSEAAIPSRAGNEIVALGDSIVADGRWRSAFAAAAGQPGIVDSSSAIGGSRLDAMYWLVDDLMRAHTPKRVLIQGGINDFYSSLKDAEFVAQATKMVVSICDKVRSYGVEPVWMGCPPRNATDNSDIEAFNTQVKSALDAIGVKNMSVYDALTASPSWSTDYYDNIATDVHPNAAGQAAIGRAWGEFYMTLDEDPPSPPTTDPWVPFSAPLPALALAPSAPGKLREVQVWDRLVGKDEIDGVPQ